MMVGPIKTWLVACARPILTEQFAEDRAREVLDTAFLRYESEAPSLAREQDLGGRLMVHCAALTASVYRVLIDEGLSEVDARALAAKVTGAVYCRMAEVPWLIARLSARSPLVRLRRATNAFRRFPFSSPSYRMEDVPGDERTVAFDVKRCPVAEYFRAQGLTELCVESFCNLDFALATKWGARLERPSTLASGAELCDFRWHLEADEAGSAPGGRGEE